jgi:Phytanoyl-CoA dioxygenase (PhyH)
MTIADVFLARVATQPKPPRSRGRRMDTSPAAWGPLTPSDDKNASPAELRESLRRNGYLYAPGFFPRRKVREVRTVLCRLMAQRGLLDPSCAVDDGIAAPDCAMGLDERRGSTTLDGLADRCPPLTRLLYGPESMRFFGRLLGGDARHYDYTWLRAVAPGFGTVPHCDRVYMSRGSNNVLTMWTPFDDIPLEMGGLMILENSHSPNVGSRLQRYLARDVDDYCVNRPFPKHVDLKSGADNKVWTGWLARNPVSLRSNLGGRWLTAEYRMGDAVVFYTTVVHASLDNQTTRFRLSTDSRYQPADEPADERFVGAGPFGHVGAAKRGRVC